MAHCLLWYKQFKKDPGFCGLSKRSQDAVSDFLGVVNELVQMGLPEDIILLSFPSSALVGSGFFTLTPSSDIRKNTLSKIYDLLASNKKITSRVVRTFTGIDSWDQDIVEKNCVLCTGDPAKRRTLSKKSFLTRLEKRKHNPSSHLNLLKAKSDITDRISKLYFINTQGQTNILENMQSSGYGEDIYGAYCIALKWASERLELEKTAKETPHDNLSA